MGLMKFLRKSAAPEKEATKQTTTKSNVKFKIIFTETVNGKTRQVTEQNSEGDAEPTDFENLTPKGVLPWGWIYKNKEFTERVNAEYSYFLNMWLESRGKSPKEQYTTLKSFVLYLDSAEKLCKSKGECFEFWFYEVLTSRDYIPKRKEELHELTINLDEMQEKYNKRIAELSDLDDRIIKMLKEHPNILQAEFVKLFNPVVQNDVSEKLYFMERSGTLERTKSGRSYILHYKG